jgi:hypothetical protein
MRIAAMLLFGIGYQVSLDIWRTSTYHPWSIDAYHLSSTAAFLCAGAVGALALKLAK